MTLVPGGRLGPYEIVAPIGAGGMGEVYRARDTRIDRTVAIKILPADFARDPASRERFDREAHAISQVDHPHICALYDVGEHQGVAYLVMQFVDGETLAARLARGPVAVDEALAIARQIADALDAAHAQGIVHRDLKPANVMLATSGGSAAPVVKVLDFGLAKETTLNTESASLSPTVLSATAGVILGTAAYMSPEQARGRPVDKRTDIWAFGCVLYEMLTGRQPFAGDTITDIIAAVVKNEPDWEALPAGTPASVRRLVSRCLQKDPRERLRDIGDARMDIVETIRTGTGASAAALPQPLPAARPGRSIAALTVVAMIALAFALGLWTQRRRASALAPVLQRNGVERPLTANPADLPVYGAAISPDGRYLAYTDANGLFLRVIDTGETHPVAVSAVTRFFEVAWYPDNTHLLLTGPSPSVDSMSLYTVSAFGGTPRKLQDDAWRAAVSPDGTSIVFLRARYPVGEVWMMGANGEQPQRFVAGDAEELYWQVGWSPDGSRVVYGVSRRGSRAIESRNRNGTDPTVILSDLSLFQNWRGVLPFRWMATGHLLYTRREPPPNETGSNLWQIAIDASGRVSGVPQRVSETIGFNVRDVTTSADGRRVAFLRERSQADVYIAPLLANPPRLAGRHRLTLDDRYDYTNDGGWMPDGSVLFESNRGASWDIFKQRPDATLAEPLVIGSDNEVDAVSTPDGAWILYRRGNRLMRTPANGGPAESVAAIADGATVRCGMRARTRCVIASMRADVMTFSELDPLRGTQRELRQVARDTSGFVNWSLSMDGRRVAVVDLADRIRIAGLDDDSLRTISLEGWTAAEFVAWSADDAGLFVQPISLKDRRLARTTLLYVDLQGRVRVLLDEENEWYIYPTASPDGRHLAFTTMRQESNAWMIER